MVQRETQKPHKRRNRNRNRKRKASSVPTSAVFLGDIFKCPAHMPLSEQEQSIVKKHLVFIKTYRQVLRLKLNANEDLWVNGVKTPDDRGGCQHLFRKVDRQTIEAALNRGQLSEHNKQRLTFLEGAAALVQDVQIWVNYFECLKATRSTSLLNAFEQSLTWVDFEQMSASKLKSLIQFLWNGFEGPTRLSLWLQLMSQKAFRQKAQSVFESTSDLNKDLLNHARIYDALWKRKGVISWSDSETQNVLREWLRLEKEVRGTLPKDTRLRLWRVLINDPSFRLGGQFWLWEYIQKDWAAAKFTEGLWAMARRALKASDYERAQAVLKHIPSADRSSREAQYFLRMLDRPRIGPYALVAEQTAEPYCGEAFWLTRGLKTYLKVMGISEGKQFVSECDDINSIKGLSKLINASGFEQGSFCIAYLSQGLPLPKFLEKERRLNAEHILYFWAEGLRLIQKLSQKGVVLGELNIGAWYADYRHHSGNIEMILTEMIRYEPGGMTDNTAYANSWNRFFLTFCETHARFKTLYRYFKQNVENAREPLTLQKDLDVAYLKYLGVTMRESFL